MHFVYLLLFVLASTSVHAGTIEFDQEFSSNGDAGFSLGGFDFVGNTNFWDVSGGVATTQDPGCGGCVGVGWSITESNSNPFSLESVDLSFCADFCFGGEAIISGAKIGGGGGYRVITDGSWHTESAFGEEWSNLSSVNIYISSGVPQSLSIDNFSASVVPVPAAVWLFGSALAGLGWMRRRQAA